MSSSSYQTRESCFSEIEKLDLCHKFDKPFSIFLYFLDVFSLCFIILHLYFNYLIF